MATEDLKRENPGQYIREHDFRMAVYAIGKHLGVTSSKVLRLALQGKIPLSRPPGEGGRFYAMASEIYACYPELGMPVPLKKAEDQDQPRKAKKGTR